MWTTNYASLSKIKPPAKAVSISRGKPRWKGGWRGHLPAGVVAHEDMRLAPSWAALAAAKAGKHDQYDTAFNAQLAKLDPAEVYAELGESAVLLCFCGVGEFCHRRIVAEWLEAALDVRIPELGYPRHETPYYTVEAYDFFARVESVDARIEAEARAAGFAIAE